MPYRGARRLPVVDREEALVGVIALDDPLEYIADELAGIARISSRGRHAERKREGRECFRALPGCLLSG